MKKVSIFVLDISQFGGIEKVVTILANNLVFMEQYEVEIISLFRTNSVPVFNIDKKVRIRYVYEGEPIDIRSNFLKIIEKCRSIGRQEKLDILITAGMGYVPITWLAFKPTKHIAWEHSNITIGKSFGLVWFGRRIAKKYLDNIVVLSKRDLKNYNRKFKGKLNIKQIYNPIEFSLSNSIYNSSAKKIISSGRLTKQKGFDILLDVANIVFSEYPEWTWDIYGEGVEREALEGKLLNLGLEKNVFIRGFVENILPVYDNYSFFVLTSRYEGFGLVITEAQSRKLPVVSFDCNSGPSELILDGVNGYLVEDGNIRQMANKIIDLIKNKDKRLDFSKKAIYDKEKFSLNNFLNSWVDVIESKDDK